MPPPRSLFRFMLPWVTGFMYLSTHAFVPSGYCYSSRPAPASPLFHNNIITSSNTHVSSSALFSSENRSKTCNVLHVDVNGNARRNILRDVAVATGAVVLAGNPGLASAAEAKDRTEGYAVQHSEREWAYILSGQQYNILRQGGTERPNSSILEGEDRRGTFVCAGCGTPLFESSGKFHSGTGWPSFATALPGVEVEDVNPVQMSLAGAELRCGTCGGHLGDVFNDGMLFVNTPAFKSGKRHCIDGAALVFKPADGSPDVFGDTPPPGNKGSGLPSFLEPPKITPR